jgi:hypothetical protein
MEIEKIVKAIKNNKGFNFDRFGNVVEFDSGYMVGGFYKCLRLTENTLEKGVIEMLGYLHDKYVGVLGVWKKGGFIYLDISKNITDLEQAKEIGFYQNQVAIYDIKNDKEIILDNDLEI